MIESVLWSVVLPTVGAVVVLLACWWPKALGGVWWNRVVVMTALTGAAFGSFVASVGWPVWPPAQKWHGLALVAAGLWFLGWADAAVRAGDWALRLVIAGCAGGLAAWLLPLPGVSALAVGCVVGAAGFVTSMVDGLGGRGAPMVLWMWVAAAATSMLVLVAGSISVALMAGAISAPAAAAWLVAMVLRSRMAVGIGGGGVAAGGLLSALAMTGWAYDYDVVPVWAWWLAVGGLPIACMLEIGPFEKWHGASASCARFVASAVPPAAAIVLNWQAIQGAMSG